jgi:hypothetical protein
VRLPPRFIRIQSAVELVNLKLRCVRWRRQGFSAAVTNARRPLPFGKQLRYQPDRAAARTLRGGIAMGWRETIISRLAVAIGAACIALSGVAAMGLEAPVRLEVGDVAGLPTSRQVLAVTLRTSVEVGGVQSDLVVPP